MTALELGLVALVLVGPGPVWVRTWSFLPRVPRAAVVLWQAGTLAALVSITLATLVVAVPLLRSWEDVDRLPATVLAGYALLGAFGLLVVGRLAWALLQVARQTGSRRARHRAAVDLLGSAEPTLALRGLRVLAESLPVAYCLPGRGARVVLSEGTLATLGTAEVHAVLAHESAHIRARHDVVLDTFSAVHRAFPVAVRSEIPVQQCRLLVEMLADDAACRVTGPLPLARALVALAGSPVPGSALGVGGTGVAQRLARLAPGASGYSRRLAGAVYTLAAALVVGPFAVLALDLLLLR